MSRREEQAASEPQTHSLLNISTLIMASLFAIAITLVTLWLTRAMIAQSAARRTAPEVVTIDAADMLIGFVTGTAPDISEEDLRRRARALNAELEAVVMRLAAEENLIVLNSGSVLAGARDITPLVLERMQATAAFGGSL